MLQGDAYRKHFLLRPCDSWTKYPPMADQAMLMLGASQGLDPILVWVVALLTAAWWRVRILFA